MAKGGSDQASTKTEPWSGQQPFLTQLFRNAQDLYNKGGVKAYAGSTVAAPGAGTVAGQAGAQASGQAAADYANQLLRTAPGMSASTQALEQQAVQPLYQQLTEQALPAVRGEALASGTYGGNRQGIAEGLATGRTAQAAGQTVASIAEAARGQDLEAQGRALALTPQIQAGQELVGQQQDAYKQQLLNEAVQRYYYNAAAPYTNLAQYQQFITGNFGSNVTQNAPGSGPGPLQSGIAGGLTGAALGSFFPGPGTAVGAGAGALLGLTGLL